MIRLKPGVQFQGRKRTSTGRTKVVRIRPEILFAIQVAEGVWERQGVELVITSLFDGEHMEKSKHYTGEAADFRSFNLPNKEEATRELQKRIGPSFQVILEETHIHVEYDPPPGEYADLG